MLSCFKNVPLSRMGLLYEVAFKLSTTSRTALGPTQPPIQWVPGAHSLGVKRPGREADHSPPSSAEVKECVDLYIHSPNTPSWRGAQFKKNTGTTLPLPFTIDGLVQNEVTLHKSNCFPTHAEKKFTRSIGNDLNHIRTAQRSA
jgi:hypothetical protein